MKRLFTITCIFSFLLIVTGSLRAGAPIGPTIPDDSTGAAGISPSAGGEDSLRWYTMFSNIPGDWLRYYQNTFKTENLPAIAGMAALTGALIATDDRTWDYSHRLYHSSTLAFNLSNNIQYLGDGVPQFELAGAFALYGFAGHNQRALRTASQIVEAILSTGGVIQVIKHVTGRQSPYVSTEPRGEWAFFPNQIDYHKHVPSYDAYPSGHIATTITTITVVMDNYPELYWYLVPVEYIAITAIGVSMANTGIHWYSDYPLGLQLGYSFAKIATHRTEDNTSTNSGVSGSGFSMFPSVNAQGGGLTVVLSF
ncbi:MAG: phosphatase PAP2 family protein [Bacteroidota bacterium]